MKKHIVQLGTIETLKLPDGLYKAQIKDVPIWNTGNTPYEAVGKLISDLEMWYDTQTQRSKTG